MLNRIVLVAQLTEEIDRGSYAVVGLFEAEDFGAHEVNEYIARLINNDASDLLFAVSLDEAWVIQEDSFNKFGDVFSYDDNLPDDDFRFNETSISCDTVDQIFDEELLKRITDYLDFPEEDLFIGSNDDAKNDVTG